jgi:hypothetical protein
MSYAGAVSRELLCNYPRTVLMYLNRSIWIKTTGTVIMRIRTKRVKDTADAKGGL